MKKRLRAFLLALAAVGCFALMCMGVLAALPLTLIGAIGFCGGLSEMMWDLVGMALFGLITVALASVCCFTGLLFLLDCCLSRFAPAYPQLDKPLAALSLGALLVTAAIFWSTRGRYFEAVCITADVLYTIFILLYFRLKRGKTHDPNRS